MCAFIRGQQAGRADVRVDLRRGQAFVSQQFLHATDVGTVIQQVGGEAVAKRVGRGATIEAAGAEMLFEHPRNAAGRQPAAKFVDEDRGLGPLLFARRKPPHAEPGLQGPNRVRADRSDPFATPFAANAERSGGQIDVAVVESGQFADAQAGGIEDFQDRSIAQPHQVVGGRSGQTADPCRRWTENEGAIAACADCAAAWRD